MDIVEMPPVAIRVTEDPPAVLTGHATGLWVISLDMSCQFLLAGECLRTEATDLITSLCHILHLVIFLVLIVVLQTNTDQAHGVVAVLVDLIITVNGQLVILRLAGDLDIIGIHHDDTLIVVITVTHLDTGMAYPSLTTKHLLL